VSVRALTWSFNLRLDDMAAKSALNALADHADEQGKCWPSIARIALFAGCSEKTARRALQRLAEMDIIDRGTRAGQSDVYLLNFDWTPPKLTTPILGGGQDDHSQPDRTPLPDCPVTPPTLTGDPSQRGSRTIKNHQKNRQGTINERPHALPADWRPSEDSWTYAIDLGLDPANVLEDFIDYWTGGQGARTKRTDWNRTWRVRCRQLAQRPPRGKGVRPSGPVSEAAAFARAAARLGGT
jgi:hypothetical protein